MAPKAGKKPAEKKPAAAEKPAEEVAEKAPAEKKPKAGKKLPKEAGAIDKKKKLTSDVHLGTLGPLSRASSKNTTPRIACMKSACAVVWDDDNAGAYAAYVEHDKVEPLWHRDFSPKGIRPTLLANDDKPLIAWYEEGRLKIAPFGRDGVGKPSVLARVNGFQPEPDFARGEKAGQWLVAFRDYESAHFEAFGLRAECQ